MQVLPFLAVAVVVVVTPGIDTALVTRNALLYGHRAAVATAVGVNVGIAFWTVAASIGLAAVVAASAEAFTAIKLAGALYLVYLGLQAIRASRRSGRVRPEAAPRAPLTRRVAFRQGLVSNLLNPKIAVFFTSLLPQFVGSGGVVAARAGAARGAVLSRPRVKRVLDRVSGMVLVGLGARLALEHRR
ncbi:MAG: LysE family translocator [Actinobacteria bacterium]|nr:MAG: LysE family translocator [Actinomycetota bacterium]